MGWFILKHIFSTIFAFITIGRLSNQEKDLEILVLRQQLSILQRKLHHPIRPNRIEKLTLATLTAKLKQIPHISNNQLRDVIRIFQPETVLRWHRELVLRKWTYPNKNKGGRPATNKELEKLILRLARENPRWGYGKIRGALVKLGFKVSQPTVRNILNRHDIQPASVRNGSIGWRHLMAHYKDQILACDFFTVETVLLQTFYVLFFIELGSRQVQFAGITTNPNQFWVAQQARQLVWRLSDREKPLRFLIHDNDRSFCPSFDAVFESEGWHVINTPVKAPNANAFAERWIRSAREECLDLILIFNAVHLRRVLIEFVEYFNAARPHQGIHQQSPIPYATPSSGTIQRRNVLGGIIHDYFRDPTRAALSTT
ncbi:MAG: integrase core domain-containing protein [Anaerolineales bacterium]|nr:integrase core domain-containing protein [Anaerolineales bacterium]